MSFCLSMCTLKKQETCISLIRKCYQRSCSSVVYEQCVYVLVSMTILDMNTLTTLTTHCWVSGVSGVLIATTDMRHHPIYLVSHQESNSRQWRWSFHTVASVWEKSRTWTWYFISFMTENNFAIKFSRHHHQKMTVKVPSHNQLFLSIMTSITVVCLIIWTLALLGLFDDCSVSRYSPGPGIRGEEGGTLSISHLDCDQ